MGDFRERLLWSKAPVVGNGTNGSSGSALTTSANGSTNWSVQDDAFPLPFFDRDTGEFQDSVQTRMKARMTINFGNPYRDKRGDSLIPEVFNNQRPPLNSSTGPQTPPASPPHDSSPSIEGEGEAIFAGRTSPPHESSKRKLSPLINTLISKKKQKTDSPKQEISTHSPEIGEDPKSPPTPPPPTGKASRKESVKKPPPPPPPKGHKKQTGPPPPPPGSVRKQPPPPRPKGAESKGAKPPPPSAPGSKPPGGNPRPPAAGMGTAAPPLPGKVPPPPGKEKKMAPNRPPPPAPPGAGPPLRPDGLHRAPSSVGAVQPVVPKSEQQDAEKSNLQPPKPAEPPKDPSLVKPDVVLPPGWISVWSKSKRRWYFFCTRTNKSVWQWPPPPK